MPLLMGSIPACHKLSIQVQDRMAETAQLVGRKRQLDPELDRAFAKDLHSSAVVAARSLEAEIFRPQHRHLAEGTVLDRLRDPLEEAAHDREPLRL
jgi:hypothetical protein